MTSKTILITGGTGKLGQVLVNHFLSVGDIVITTSRTDSALADLTARCPDHGGRLIGISVDLASPQGVKTLCGRIEESGVSPDALINNARSIDFLKIENDGLVSRENFANEFLLDVIVPYELTMALAMQEGTHLRHVLNVGSQYGTVAANPNLYTDPVKQSPLQYSVAKAALVHLTKELAVRLAKKNVQVNCVSFGGVEGRVDDAFRQRYAQFCPSGRMLREDEVVGPVDMLLSDRCSGITGHVLAVDGGWTIW